MGLEQVVRDCQEEIAMWKTMWNIMHTGRNTAWARIEELETEVETLRAVIDNLCEQQDLQRGLEEATSWPSCSYPSKFPEWEQAWERAREVRWD